MRVAYVTPYYNGEIDGRYGRFLDWIHWLRDSDDPQFEFDLFPLTLSNPDVAVTSRPHSFLGSGTELWGSKLNKLEHVLNVPGVINNLRATDYDVIHVIVMDPLVFPAVVSANRSSRVVVGPDIAGWSHVRDVPYWERTRADRLENHAKYRLRRLLGSRQWYDRAVAFSEHHRDILASFSIPEGRIDVLPAGVDPRFHPGDERTHSPPELLYVGDFSGHKGYPSLLRAIARLEIPMSVRLVGAGDSNEQLIERLGIADIATVEGFVSRDRLPDIYRSADLFVMPSIDETAGGNTQIEALASGLPVVITDQPGVDEYAPEGAKVTIQDRSPQSIAQGIRQAINNLQNMTDVARAHAGSFTPAATVAALTETYRAAIEPGWPT